VHRCSLLGRRCQLVPAIRRGCCQLSGCANPIWLATVRGRLLVWRLPKEADMFKFWGGNVPSVCKILVCNAAGVLGGAACSDEQQMHHTPRSFQQPLP
jgi:hypothetical protein